MSKSRDHAGLQNLDHLSVAAGCDSNVSRYALSTTTATATQYAKLLTLAFPATSNVAANITLLLTPKSVAGQYSPVLATVTALQGASGLSTSSKIEILSSNETAIAHTGLFLDTASATNGTNVDLWMQSIIAAAYDVQVIAESFDTGVSVSTYNDGATWTASAPAGAVTITSDWAGSGWQSITPQNGWTDTVIQYRKGADGLTEIRLYQSSVVGTITNGTVIGTIPSDSGARHAFAADLPMEVGGFGGTNGQVGRLLINSSGSIAIYDMVATPSSIRAKIVYLAEQ